MNDDAYPAHSRYSETLPGDPIRWLSAHPRPWRPGGHSVDEPGPRKRTVYDATGELIGTFFTTEAAGLAIEAVNGAGARPEQERPAAGSSESACDRLFVAAELLDAAVQMLKPPDTELGRLRATAGEVRERAWRVHREACGSASRRPEHGSG